MNTRTIGEFDIRPNPRVLPMLGEINLDLWRCVAELVDNSVDGFLHAIRAGTSLETPMVLVNLPTSSVSTARVHVRDNGPGMDPATLQQAVSAGWTGNNPIDNLGLFGMGFNIATARLGSLTRVRTTRAGDPEWHVLEIDFDAFQRNRHFRTPHIIEPKVDPSETGTEVIVSRLKPEQLQSLSKPRTLSRIRRELSKTYAAMLRPNGTPTEFRLEVNGQSLRPRSLCTWNHDRLAEQPNGVRMPAIIPIDVTLPARRYCIDCMRWLAVSEQSCLYTTCHIVERPRRVRGWIGLQRYAHESEYGFDFLRNGRKIEFGVKDLFVWNNEGIVEKEYPVDDPRYKGRFVGEIHLDHCRVSYDKTRFERSDPAWEEMVEIVRGQGPLQPTKARDFPQNNSPLYRLYQVFRRNGPRIRGGTGWERILSYPDTPQAEEWLNLFHEGMPEYQDDNKWFELVLAADRKDVREDQRQVVGGMEGEGGLPTGLVDDEVVESLEQPNISGEASALVTNTPQVVAPIVLPVRRPSAELSGTYRVPDGPEAKVEAYEAAPDDPGLEGKPWAGLTMSQLATRTRLFLFDPRNQIFRSATFTPLDALLIVVARFMEEASRGSGVPIDFRDALVSLRLTHARGQALDTTQIVAEAAAELSELARALAGHVDEDTSTALFDELSADEKRDVLLRMARRGVTSNAGLLANGGFIEYLDWQGLRSLFERRPQMFLDGRFWDAPYEEIDLGDTTATNAARKNVVDRFSNLIADAARVAAMDPVDLAHESRDELIRAILSVRLLRPDIESA